MRLRLLLSALAFAFNLPCAASESPKIAIQQVITTFQSSLKKHDAKMLGSLFLPGSQAWVTTIGFDTLKKVRRKHPNASRYKIGTRESFLDFVGVNKSSIAENFHNVRIQTDGSVASIYFDFEFLMNGKVQNCGAETWQMVRTDDGWKIAAMLYSSNF